MAKKQDSGKKKIAPRQEGKTMPILANVKFDFLEKNGILIASGALLAMLLVLFSQFVFGDRLMLFKDAGSDTIGGFWPLYEHYAHYFRTDGIPKWSFTQGIGTSVFPAFLGDVVADILYIIKPQNIPYAFAYIQMLKIFFAGLFFFLFLRKKGLSHYVSLIGAAMFSFSGFVTIGSTWHVFCSEAMNLALLLYGLELLRQNNNILVFPIAVALTAAINPVYLYLDVLLVVAYLAICFLDNGFKKTDINFLGKAIFLGILGVGIATFIIVGNLDQIIESPRGGGLVSYDKELSKQQVFHLEKSIFYETFALRLLGNDMCGACGRGGGDAYKGWNNWFEAPAHYCGLIVLLLLPQLFVLARRRLKILAAAALAIAALTVIFPYFRLAFWLFSGDYFRTYSLFFYLLEILLALKALELIIERQKINIPLLMATYLIILGILFFIPTANDELQPLVLFFLTAELLLILAFHYPSLRRAAMIALMPFVFIELIVMSWGTFCNTRETLSKTELATRTGYNDHTLEALSYIRSHDNGFYRIHKNYFSGPFTKMTSYNDALIQNYFSSASYYSFNNMNYARFLQKTEVISNTYKEGYSAEIFTRFIGGVVNRPLLMELISSKYLFSKGPWDKVYNLWYDSIAVFDDVKVLKNRLFLPLGFTYDRYISEKDMAPISTLHKDFMMLLCGVLDTSQEINGLVHMTAKDSTIIDTFSVNALAGIIDHLRTDSLHISLFSQNHLEGDIKTDRKKILFLSIPYSKGWHMKVDGNDVKPLMVNFGFLGCLLEPGGHKVELTFEPPYYTAGMEASVISLILYGGLVIIVIVSRRRKKQTV